MKNEGTRGREESPALTLGTEITELSAEAWSPERGVVVLII